MAHAKSKQEEIAHGGSVKQTGIFFTYFLGERLRDFPQALTGILDKENVSYYDAVYDSSDGLYYWNQCLRKYYLKFIPGIWCSG